MTDVNAGINVRINTEDALGQLRQLQAGISAFNQSVIGTNTTAVNKQQELIRTFAAQVESTKQFATGIANVETSVGKLSNPRGMRSLIKSRNMRGRGALSLKRLPLS